ncbi:MAG: hypothetical protein ACRDHW_01955, partial [Ktedonobacteraceae bacterium]
MECPYCKAQNRENVRFCNSCGQQVQQTQGSSAPGTTTGSGTRGSASSLTAGMPLQGGRYS